MVLVSPGRRIQPGGVRSGARFLNIGSTLLSSDTADPSDDSLVQRSKFSVRRQPGRRITELHDSDVTMPHFSNKDHISPKFRRRLFQTCRARLKRRPKLTELSKRCLKP
jgi:hypothetical protein